MKKNIFFGLAIFLMVFSSCNKNDEEYADYLVARPLVVSKAEFADSVSIIDPIPINESGKIYAYQNYIFINDKYQGVHVIDNSNPETPRKIAFIKILGNVDISVKGDFLYADSITDLIVLDISNINAIEQINRLEGVLRDNVVFPARAEIFEWGEIDYEKDMVIGWETVVERRKIEEVPQPDIFIDFAETANDSGGNTGQGGSLARFKIVDDYLYAVDSHTINVFEISDLANPIDLEDVYAGFDIETIFNKGSHLFLGSMSGMFIYDITNPSAPTFVSEFQHGTACDPVVVDDNYAYVTLRGGNFCGATESGLYVVDISTIENPELKVIYPMDEPYGLGIKDDKLFICDGASGLKVYDKSNVPDLPQLNHFKDIVTFDVIPMEEQLLMIGDGILHQYKYLNNEIQLISQLQLN